MTDEDFGQLVALGERQGVEFKNSRPRATGPQLVEVAKAVLAMSNRRGGGTIVIGVDPDGTLTGMTQAHYETWLNPDHVRGSFRPYADPYVQLDVDPTIITAGDLAGRRFIVLHVHQFDEIPVLCAREGRNAQNDLILKLGKLYVRSKENVESVEVATQAQMRELIDLAVDYGIRKWLARNEVVGITLQFQAQPDAEAAFAQEREDFDDGN
jgi:hypothetical protein